MVKNSLSTSQVLRTQPTRSEANEVGGKLDRTLERAETGEGVVGNARQGQKGHKPTQSERPRIVIGETVKKEGLCLDEVKSN